MPPTTRAIIGLLATVHALTSTSAPMSAQPAGDDVGLIGVVLTPEGAPVSSGLVTLYGPASRATASIDEAGRFQLVPDGAGRYHLTVTATGFAPYRAAVTVPPSRHMWLPPLQLSPPTYFRARIVSPTGEEVQAPRLRRQSVDVTGTPVFHPPDDPVTDRVDAAGQLTIGPLPPGVTTVALNTPPFAQARLRDLYVTGEGTTLDGGTVVLQTGTTLMVDVLDRTGAPIVAHDVVLEDALPLSPLQFAPQRTDAMGRATFTRLGAGRYRILTRVPERCGGAMLAAARVVSVSGTGTARTRLVADGTVTFTLASPSGPLGGVLVFASPDTFAPTPPPWLREPAGKAPMVPRPRGAFANESSCGGRTDADGRLTLDNFPPGAAQVTVRLPNSSYVRRVSVPDNPGDVVIRVPDGLLSVRVVNALTNAPVPQASVTWSGGGSRAEAITTGTGDALLESVTATPGALAIRARAFDAVEAKLKEPPGEAQEVRLVPSPPVTLQARLVSTSEAVSDAVVQLVPANPLEVIQIAAADARGVVTFADVPPGAVRLTAVAPGFGTVNATIAPDVRSAIVMTLSR